MSLIQIPNQGNRHLKSVTTLNFIQQFSIGQKYLFGLKRVEKGKYKYVIHIVCDATLGDIAFLSRQFLEVDCFFISDLNPEENENLIEQIKTEDEYHFYDA
jgi:hypothetical protein